MVCVFPLLNLFLRENDSEISVHKSKFQNYFSLLSKFNEIKNIVTFL